MNGPFGNGFPYTNFQELNMDWIIRIAKDFLDQYTHIQDVITAGESSLNDTTNAGIEALQAEKTRLEGLLDAWYTTHSEDIAGELTDAIADFRTAAEAIGAEVIASIPEDYTALTAKVSVLEYTSKAVTESIENNFQQITGNRGLTFISGRYTSPTTTSIGETISYDSNNSYVCAIASCTKGDKFNVHIYGYTGNTRGYFICDNTMTCLSKMTQTSTEINKVITITEDTAAYIVFNNRLSNLASGYFVYKNESLISKFNNIFEPCNSCYITQGKTDALEGITISPVSDHEALIYGSNSAQAVRIINFTNGAWGLVPSSQNNVKRIPEGTYTLNYTFTSSEDLSDVSFYIITTSIDAGGAAVVKNNETFTSDAPFILVMRVIGEQDFGTENNPTTLALNLYKKNVKDIRTIEPTDDTTDRSAEIQTVLYAYGKCQLSAGRYYVSGITMPDNSELAGSGSSTEIILLDSVSTGSAIRPGANCIVSDLAVIGGSETPTFTNLGIDTISIGTRHGILWLGEGADNTKVNTLIDNVFIKNFTGGGITCDNTGYSTNAGMTVSNAHIDSCGAGINVAYWSEFNRFTNVKVRSCFYGCICNGGNNSFVNCGFSSNNTGFYVNEAAGKAVRYNGTTETARNGSHGQVNGCIINHSGMTDYAGSNAGYAIYNVGSDAGFIFNTMNIFYGKIYLKNASYIMLTNSRLTGVEFTVYGNSGTFIANMCYMNISGSNPVSATVLDKDTDLDYTDYDSSGNGTRSKLINCFNHKGESISLQTLASVVVG